MLLALLAHFGQINLAVFAKAIGHPALLGFAAFLILITIPIAALRWWLLLRALKYSMGVRWALRTIFISQFMNTFLPGAYGGDIVRVALGYRAAKSGLSRLTLSVVVDRVSGLVGLLLLALIVLPMLPTQAREDAVLPLTLAVCTVIIGVAVVVTNGNRLAVLIARVPKIGCKIAHFINEVLVAIKIYMGHTSVLAMAILLSVVQFALVLVALAVIGSAMNFDALSPVGYAVAGVWSVIANAIPLTPGGIGIGEAAFAHVAVMLESAPSGASYATVFLAMRVLVVLASAVGLIPYLPNRMELRRDVATVEKTIESR